MSYTLFVFYGLMFSMCLFCLCFYLSIIFREVLIIYICNCISKSPST